MTKSLSLWYNRHIVKAHSVRTCSLCNSPLILVSEVTEQKEGCRFPQTTTVYRCSNQMCQEEKDKQAEKRLQLRNEKKRIDDQRATKKLEEKRLKQEKHIENLHT